MCLMAGLTVGFPVDARYGWDINCAEHQVMLDKCQRQFSPAHLHTAPDCAPWSIAGNSKDPNIRSEERLQDRPGLEFLQRSLQRQSHEDRLFTLEQPLSSAMWKPEERGGESPINIEVIKGCKNIQSVDQCCHGAVDENNEAVQKATGIAANFKLKNIAKRCSGHHGRKHAQLKGAVNGIPRTAAAAAYPRTRCQRLKLDIMSAMKDRGLLYVRPWPRDLHWFNHEVYY